MNKYISTMKILPVYEKTIIYFGQPMKVGCDGKCHKAWGIQGRPRIRVGKDEDDVVFLSDLELGMAPEEPGTWEGFEMCGKPTYSEDKLNKWCVRNCERCERSEIGQPEQELELPNWDERMYNIPSKHN